MEDAYLLAERYGLVRQMREIEQNLNKLMKGLREISDVHPDTNTDLEKAEDLGNRAKMLAASGDIQEALRLSREQEGIYRDIQDTKALREALSLRSDFLCHHALSLEKSGRLADAIRFLKEQEVLCQELGYYHTLQACIGIQARILNAQGRNDDAIVLYERKKDICQAHGFSDGLVICLGNLANVYTAKRDYARALGLHQEAEAVSRRTGQIDGLVLALTNQAAIFAQAMNRADDARSLIDEAMSLVSRHSLTSLKPQIEAVVRIIQEKERRT
jgi:tetratricopeptide (TPR) repeat protein